MVIQCDNCNATVQLEEVGFYVRENPYDFFDSEKYIFGKCVQCLYPILVEQELDLIASEMEWSRSKKIYPSNTFHINPVIPEKLQQSLLECVQCYKSEAFTATAIICRRTLEGFCMIKGVSEKNLDKAIKKLKDDGAINEQLYEWANQLRLVGNEAAHNIEANFSVVDAKDILDFTIAILDFTYSFKDKFDKFKARHSKT